MEVLPRHFVPYISLELGRWLSGGIKASRSLLLLINPKFTLNHLSCTELPVVLFLVLLYCCTLNLFLNYLWFCIISKSLLSLCAKIVMDRDSFKANSSTLHFNNSLLGNYICLLSFILFYKFLTRKFPRPRVSHILTVCSFSVVSLILCFFIMGKLDLLISQRKIIRTKVTNLHSTKDDLRNLQSHEKLANKGILISYKDQLRDFDSQIQQLKFATVDTIDEKALGDEMNLCQNYQVKIEECVSLLTTGLVNNGSQSVLQTYLRSPVAPLPKFESREGEDLIKFLKEFEDTLSPHNITSRDKFILLKEQVKGRSLVLLNALETDKHDFESAKSLLIDALASNETRIFTLIKSLTELNLSYTDDPYEYIAKVKSIQEAVGNLKIDVNHILQYFVWSGLNDSFKMHLTQISNKTKPNITEIVKHFFDACERYEYRRKHSRFSKPVGTSNSSSKQSSKITHSLAVDVKQHKPQCNLCLKSGERDTDHALIKCPKFSSPSMKIEKILKLKGCRKCARFSHEYESCNFRFKNKCHKCGGWHFSFLCTKSPKDKEDKTSSGSDPPETNAGISLGLPAIDTCTFVPTFTFHINDGIFRGMRDGGSQNCFISESFYQKHKFPILEDDFELKVRGINDCKLYTTKLVQVELEIASVKYTIEALVLPQLGISISLPHLGPIVDAFNGKGYKFADVLLTKYSDGLHDIELILGNSFAYILPAKDIAFGKNPPSIYQDTPAGIMLMGKLARIKQNLKALPVLNLETSNSPHNVQTIFSMHAKFSSKSDIDIGQANKRDPNSDIFDILDNKGKVVEHRLESAAEQILNDEYKYFVGYDSHHYKEDTSVLNDQLISYTLGKIERNDEGRIIVPLLWNGSVAHHLSKNEGLAKAVLSTTGKKLRKNPELLKLVDETLREQENVGIIERVFNIESFKKEYPQYSFLAHMPIFRLEKSTSKCRVVYLSNIAEKCPNAPLKVSHNMAIHAGPTLNQKLAVSLIHMRFDKYLLTYDLKKAFNQLELNPSDQSRLLFLWFRNVNKNDFTPIVYKSKRLPFGLRCSPFDLMISLYHMLVIDTEDDSDKVQSLKKNLYHLLYMDNGGSTSNSESELKWQLEEIPKVFREYKFDIQQVHTNCKEVQSLVKEEGVSDKEIKLLGLNWNKESDTLSTRKIQLDSNANTKRTILSTIASHFDVFNFTLPLLNRARIFLHRLQCNQELRWDDELDSASLREWKNITRQVNSSPNIVIPRQIGPRNHEYNLVTFSDASRDFFGVVVYLQDLTDNSLHFLTARNRIISKQLKLKSIPSLEMNAVSLGAETLIELYNDLAGSNCMVPLNIRNLILYTDSTCCLHWLDSLAIKMEKPSKRSAFVLNRLNIIQKQCETHPIQFKHVQGHLNPADCVTRCLSHNLLIKSTFFTGPDMTLLQPANYEAADIVSVTLPNPLLNAESQCLHSELVSLSPEHVVNVKKFSTYGRLLRAHKAVLNCYRKWRQRAGIENPNQESSTLQQAHLHVIRAEQHEHFSDIFEYLNNPQDYTLSKIPTLANKLNIFIDQNGLLRVKGKFCKWGSDQNNEFPILLDDKSYITKLIIEQIHKVLNHAGVFVVLNELKHKYHIPKHFSVVKKILKACLFCTRMHGRTLKNNQNAYRDFRVDPPHVPFAFTFVDFLGPFNVKCDNSTEKRYICIFSCCFTRAVHLIYCKDLSVDEYLRALQLHTFRYGLPQRVISDLGSNLVAGGNLLTDFLNDPIVFDYLKQNNVQTTTFEQFFKGKSSLGSLVESGVKLVKHLMYGSMGRLILSSRDFQFLISHVNHLVNRRPIAFRESLRTDLHEVPEPITPEMLLHGRELISLNLVPSIHDPISQDPDWSVAASLSHEFDKFKKVKENLYATYLNEFTTNLLLQSIDRVDRYKPVENKCIKVGSLVLIKDPMQKPINYPIARIKEVQKNSIGEITGAILIKGKTNEEVKRHSSCIIPLLELKESEEIIQAQEEKTEVPKSSKKPVRKAAGKGRKFIQNLINQGSL